MLLRVIVGTYDAGLSSNLPDQILGILELTLPAPSVFCQIDSE
jgi:hypothetical protein